MALVQFITQKIEHSKTWEPDGTMQSAINFETIKSAINGIYNGRFITEGEPIFSVTETHYFVTFRVRKVDADNEDAKEDGPLPMGYSVTKLNT